MAAASKARRRSISHQKEIVFLDDSSATRPRRGQRREADSVDGGANSRAPAYQRRSSARVARRAPSSMTIRATIVNVLHKILAVAHRRHNSSRPHGNYDTDDTCWLIAATANDPALKTDAAEACNVVKYTKRREARVLQEGMRINDIRSLSATSTC